MNNAVYAVPPGCVGTKVEYIPHEKIAWRGDGCKQASTIVTIIIER